MASVQHIGVFGASLKAKNKVQSGCVSASQKRHENSWVQAVCCTRKDMHGPLAWLGSDVVVRHALHERHEVTKWIGFGQKSIGTSG